MLAKRIIPCLDVTGGRVVKGVNFVELRDAGDPVEIAARYNEQGADELTFLDITATSDGRDLILHMIEAVASQVFIPLTVGGGVRSIADAEALLTEGADKVAVNTAALETPSLLAALATRFGRQCITLAIDAASDGHGGWQVFSRSGTTATARDAVAWAREAEQLGAGEILLTSIDRDGTRQGFDVALVRAVSSQVRLPVMASGGARTAEDHLLAIEAGADAVLAASMFHDGDTTVSAVKDYLASRGVEVRR